MNVMLRAFRLGWRTLLMCGAAYACVAMILLAATPSMAAEDRPFPRLELVSDNAEGGTADGTAPDQAAEPGDQPDKDAPAADGGEPPVAEGPRSSACAWLGQRIVSLLIRNDAMTAKDFTPFYERFNCPEDHLVRVFACTIRTNEMVQDTVLADVVLGCWRSPEMADGAPPPQDQEESAAPRSSYQGSLARP